MKSYEFRVESVSKLHFCFERKRVCNTYKDFINTHQHTPIFVVRRSMSNVIMCYLHGKFHEGNIFSSGRMTESRVCMCVSHIDVFMHVCMYGV